VRLGDKYKGIGLDPKYSTAYQGRGLMKSQKGDNDGAFADFNEAIRLEPKSAAAHVGRGWVSYSKGEKDRAIIDYDQAIELDPKFALAYTDRALAKFSKRDYEGAAMDLSQLIVLDPNNAQAYVDRATIELIARDFDRAIADYGETVRLDAKLAYPRFYIWLIRFQQQRTAQANEELAAYLDKGTGLSGGDWTTKVGTFLLGRITEADFLAAASSPDNQKDRNQHCEAWYYAGMKRLFAGDKKTAGVC
jgi:tetratricopeptide (TPR) repeat protein